MSLAKKELSDKNKANDKSNDVKCVFNIRVIKEPSQKVS
uniref:Uncharacterized protein n=1 Tax=Dulem virus 62 TaxID=3145773 RepID=A0AAU8B1P0_9VIRU